MLNQQLNPNHFFVVNNLNPLSEINKSKTSNLVPLCQLFRNHSPLSETICLSISGL